MGFLIGPTPWWQANIVSASPVGTTLPDGSRIICKAGGTAWIVAPNTTQVSSTWNGTTTLLVGDKCCVCDWSTLCACLITTGFNPSDWFVPSFAQLQNPGFVCRTNWDSISNTYYWSSTEATNVVACPLNPLDNSSCFGGKGLGTCVRAFRCVTY